MWSEIIPLQVGSKIVGVGIDSNRTARRVRAATSRWREVEHQGVRAVWNVRAEGGRLARGRGGALHHGRRVVDRFRSVDDAVDALIGVLAQIEAPTEPGVAQIDCRLLMIHDEPVLYVPPAGAIAFDPSRLSHAGIREVPVHRVRLDESTGAWVGGPRSRPLAAIVVTAVKTAPAVDEALRTAWGAADHASIALAETLDRLRPIVHPMPMETSEDELIALAGTLGTQSSHP